MSVCYNKLWKLMIDRKMKKKDLIALSGISRSTVAKLTRDENEPLCAENGYVLDVKKILMR